MQTVRLNTTQGFPLELLLPMRLIIYNAGSRKLVITHDAIDLPQPIVLWLQESAQHQRLIDRIVDQSATPTAGESFTP
jgi:hypothetical protein